MKNTRRVVLVASMTAGAILFFAGMSTSYRLMETRMDKLERALRDARIKVEGYDAMLASMALDPCNKEDENG